MAKAKSMKRSNSVIGSAVRALQCGLLSQSADVKKGHFVVVAVDVDEEPKRFIVSLTCLSHPVFLRQLDRAEEEFGFGQDGAITLPCRPSELERIIGEI